MSSITSVELDVCVYVTARPSAGTVVGVSCPHSAATMAVSPLAVQCIKYSTISTRESIAYIASKREGGRCATTVVHYMYATAVGASSYYTNRTHTVVLTTTARGMQLSTIQYGTVQRRRTRECAMQRY